MGESMLAFASTPVFRGDQEWTETTSQMMLVPEDTTSILVKAVLTGVGKAWFDDLAVTVVEGSDAASSRDDVQSADGLADAVPGRIMMQIPIEKDCMILSYLPQWKYGNVDNIAVANNNGGVRTLLNWGMDLPRNALVNNRKFFVALYSRKTTRQPNSGLVNVYGVQDDWPEITSWNTQPSITSKPISQAEFSPAEGWKLFDVTKLVTKQAVEGNGHGVMLRFDVEDKLAKNWSGYHFVSREGVGESRRRRPVLLVVDASEDNP